MIESKGNEWRSRIALAVTRASWVGLETGDIESNMSGTETEIRTTECHCEYYDPANALMAKGHARKLKP